MPKPHEREPLLGQEPEGPGVFEPTIKDIESDPSALQLPQIVRESVPLNDDPSIPVFTFRYFLLATILVVPGAFVGTLNSFRTTSAAYSIFFVQFASHYLGKQLAASLPSKTIDVGLFKFNTNPGPWSIKETALITVTANSGATGNLATNALALAELHFKDTVSAAVAIPFMFAIVFIGYAYAAICKDLLLYDPEYIWPQALMQSTVLQTQNNTHTSLGQKQVKLLGAALLFMTVWQLLPEFAFPMVSSVAVICYMAPKSKTLNFVGSGLGGIGFLNFTFDWSNITSTIMLYPYWIQVIQFVAFVICCWILIPIVQFTEAVPSFGLMSNSVFTENGEKYPTSQLLTPELKFNSTAYETLGPARLGPQRVWNIFFDYAAYISGITWVVLFGYENLSSSFKKLKFKVTYKDRLNELARNYDTIPRSWYVIMFFISFGTLMIIFGFGQMFMPWWCCIIGLGLGSIIVTPLAWLYALSNFQLPIGTFNELFYGYLVQSREVHPASGSVFGSIAGDAWYRAQYHLECLKLGFYIHLPPRSVFLAQIYGELVGIPVNYLALRWVLSSKRDYLLGNLIDPLHQWTGQDIESTHTNAIQYVVLGPSRLFENYHYLPLGFVLGAVAPYVLFKLHRKYPRFGFNFWNTTVFFSSMSKFYGNISTGGLSKMIGGTVTMFYVFRYHHKVWKNFNYVMAAGLDTGYNLSVLIIFVITSFTVIRMPHWFGNNEDSVERCFALEK
ncbi:hypothetical protein CANTEDRAFT_108167 [Yamadazyma tenuis ATCC 10573]|uniref:OPT superfamily oligopeptide transporter n=1 Tax=Candida tenuis (strain ATCC 10573 / BCRC 21748 / CBS 615 / JCM 9827 / NBRC 10315 / NRRL Y-1498 / VKM Y-70) TaxID=590646 RepID=G3B9I3_CANTC|nr:uncharacterized protein CANTEDRAFT_108167 [Yamadazyma tenuis ATCC 10573]EGV61894.1 hypothetical protein CANTEDRAFT_108167 [Yamadazyma tenuis ATCC 10573]